MRVCLDENMTSVALLDEGDVDTLALDDIIRSKVLDAARMVEMSAPVDLLENGHSLFVDGDEAKSGLYWGKDNSGWIVLPSDFMRLIVFEMDDWARPVTEAIRADSAMYKLQRCSVAGVRGNWERPVCAVVVRPEGKVLEFYSCKSEDASVSRGVYLPYPSIDDSGGVDLSERCYGGVVYTAAGLVLATMGKAEMSENMMKHGERMILMGGKE